MTDVGRLNHQLGGRKGPGDADVALLAADGHGVAGRDELLELGLSRRMIDRRVESGRFHALYPGVYAIGHRALKREGRWRAAVLACGPSAVLSHRSAAALWDLRAEAQARVDVTGPRGRKGHPGIRVHRVRQLATEDRTVVNGIPVTTVARTVLDLAEVLNLRQLRAVLEQAERLRLFDLAQITATIERNPGRRGIKPLSTLLKDAVDLAPENRSKLERAFLDFCKRHDIPRPRINTSVAGYEVDAFWPEHRLVAELDTRTFHATRAAFERDRQKDAALQLAGYRVLRITGRRLAADPAGVASELKSFLDQR